MTEKHTFDCTPRESRRIAENLRYTAAARELAERASDIADLWTDGFITNGSGDFAGNAAMNSLKIALSAFRTIADE